MGGLKPKSLMEDKSSELGARSFQRDPVLIMKTTRGRFWSLHCVFKNRWLFCVFFPFVVQTFCNKTMAKHRSVQRTTTSPAGGHLLFFVCFVLFFFIWDGEC